MILPSCRVTMGKLAKDAIEVLHFDPDFRYFEAQKNGGAPGLFNVKTGQRD